MAQSALLTNIKPRTISFKHCVQLWLTYLQQSQILDDDRLAEFFQMMAQQCVGNRPGRIELRAVKRRPKAYHLLMIRRSEARENVKKNGHPKKLK